LLKRLSQYKGQKWHVGANQSQINRKSIANQLMTEHVGANQPQIKCLSNASNCCN